MYCVALVLCGLQMLGAQTQQKIATYLGGYTAVIFNLQSDAFFQRYQLLGGQRRSFDPAHFWGGETFIEIAPFLIAGATVAYYEWRLQESYAQAVRQQDTILGFRYFHQNVRWKVLPVMARIEWHPYYRLQFRSYVGGQVGFAAIRAFWEESVSSSLAADTRRGGVRLQDEYLVPAFQIFTGIALGFDQYPYTNRILYGLVIEAAYSYLPLNEPLFLRFPNEEAAKTSENIPLNLGGISVHIGVRLRF